jgi:uncharacterized protein YaiI (UPF0178 family)
MLDIYVDADACPVKQEVYKVASRLNLKVFVVSNSPIYIPASPAQIHSITVNHEENAADDWIAEKIGVGDICITSDIPLASRCLTRGASVLGPRGKPFTEDSIGDALATRELVSSLREIGQMTDGPKPMTKKDRSRFLDNLDRIIQTIRNKHAQN